MKASLYSKSITVLFIAIFLIAFSISTSWANMPAPWHNCEGKAVGDSCATGMECVVPDDTSYCPDDDIFTLFSRSG